MIIDRYWYLLLARLNFIVFNFDTSNDIYRLIFKQYQITNKTQEFKFVG